MAKRPTLTESAQAAPAGPMPWEDEAPGSNAAAAAGTEAMPWEDPAPSDRPKHQAPPTWSQNRQEEIASDHPLYDKITAYNEPDFHHPIDAIGTTVGNLGGAAIKAVGDFALPGGMAEQIGHGIMHPQDTAKSLVESISGKPYNPNDATILPDPRKALKTGVQTAAMLPAAEVGAESVGPLTKTVGKGLKGAGRVAGEMTLGTDAVDRANASPGAGISENRVVSMTRPGLQQKVSGKIGQLKANEAEILDQHSNRGPIDTRTTINAPFLDTMARTTNYRTGVGSRPEMQQHWSTLENLNYAQDPKGGLLRDPITQQPVPKGIDAHNPLEAAIFKSNMYKMADYDSAGSGMANADIQRGAAALRNKIIETVPESEAATNKLHNTEAAVDVLDRQRGHSLAGARPFSKNKLIDMVRVPVGSSAAAGLDLLGSGLMKVGDVLSPGNQGGGGATPTTNPPNAQGQGPTITGNLPAPRAPLPQGQPALRSGQTITPPPAPIAGQLPGAVQGPLTRVVTRVGGKFGPKVEAPAFSKPVGREIGKGQYGGDPIDSPEAERRNAEDNNGAREAYQNRRKGDSLTSKVAPKEGEVISVTPEQRQWINRVLAGKEPGYTASQWTEKKLLKLIDVNTRGMEEDQ